MADVVIENPIINSPFDEPQRHFQFDEDGITNTVLPERRTSQYFVPVAAPRKRGTQLHLQGEWTEDRIEENREVNRIRGRVGQWRQGGYQGVTKTTRRLLDYWTRAERDHKLFFCQIEALETAIYISEVARKAGDNWIENLLREANERANPGLFRIAFKMATGTGKTVVMAMLIAWQALNKFANPHDARFNDAFLVVTPGITIRDRLRVLLPSDPGNYYRQHDIVPPDLRDQLGRIKMVVTNFHAFLRREGSEASKLAKEILPDADAFRETPDQMVRRVCRSLGNKKNIIVINDEAHHCYQRRPDEHEDEHLDRDERREAEKRDEKARVWISGIRAVANKIGVRSIYDLSATPFFLRGSGYSEGTLFPWVVSDFSLIDAIESGIVKVPRVPVADDSMVDDIPKYRNLWHHIREDLPRKGRGTEPVTGEPILPAELQGALHSLYSNYEKYYETWESNSEARANGFTPPVFIVVCNNTNVSKLVYDFIAGWEKPISEDETVVVPGNLDIFRNDDGNGGWLPRPNTILVDSEQLESGEAMSREFKKIAQGEIEEFKSEYRRRFPDRDVESLSDEDLLREVLNTVGKPGKLGEHIKCVVSVSMLSEGWDANTVTHILGVRAFGTQLLCEQVVGRGLRRMSYAVEEREVTARGETAEFEGFSPEYAEVYGVPFSFIPSSGGPVDPRPGPTPTRVRALEERADCEITFPRVDGYKYEMGVERLSYRFNEDSRMILSTIDVPTRVENEPIVGEGVIHRLDDLSSRREQEVSFLLAKLVLEKYFRLDGNEQPEVEEEHRFVSEVQAWLFPQVLSISREWMAECLVCHDNTFPQLLLLIEKAHNAADRIYRAIASAEEGEKRLKPLLYPYDPVGSTRYVDFDTTRPVYTTDPAKCHVSHVVADTGSWEQKMAQTLEEMDEVACYVKNHNVGFKIPYTVDGEERNYIPDFIVRIDDGHDDSLNLVIEVTGERDEDKAAKVATARNLWVPAINNHGQFGRWAFIEIRDPWNGSTEIRAMLAKCSRGGAT